MDKKTKRHLSVKNEMYLWGILFLSVISLLFLGPVLKMVYENTMGSARNTLGQCGRQAVIFMDALFHENATVVEILSHDDTVIYAGHGDPDAVYTILDGVHKLNSNIKYIYSGYSDGSLLISNYPKPLDYASTTRPWYQAAADTDGVAMLTYKDAATGVWLLSQSKKLTDRDGNVVGAVCIDCSNDSITKQLGTKREYDTQRSYITDKDGVVLIHPNDKEINTSMRDRMGEEAWSSVAAGKSRYVEYRNGNGKAIGYFERIPGTDLIVVTAVEVSEIIHPIIRSTAIVLCLVAVIAIVLGVFFSRMLYRRFASPLLELAGRIREGEAGPQEAAWKLRFANYEMSSAAESIEIAVKNIINREEEGKAQEYFRLHDSTTGLYNKKYFEEELQRLDAAECCPLGIISCDVNGLTMVNDVLGFEVGDRLLCTVASCIEKGCREGDIAARVGGDEFAILLPGASAEDAQQVIMMIKARFPGKGIRGAEVSVSFGYAVRTEKSMPVAEVLHKADGMLHECKIMESMNMEKRTAGNILAAAQAEGLVKSLTEKEARLLNAFALALCPQSEEILRESYRLRRIGQCSLIDRGTGGRKQGEGKCAETCYRILTAMETCRTAAGYVLHYREHWDGSGCPTGLSGKDIPLLSRIMAVTDAYMENAAEESWRAKGGSLFDAELTELLYGWLQSGKME